MDLVLVAGSITLSLCLPRHMTSHISADYTQAASLKQYPHQPKNQPNSGLDGPNAAMPLPLSISAAVSFWLLSLSILEAIPSSWMIIVDESYLPTAYRILFAGLVLFVFVVFPFVTGSKQQQLLLHGLFGRRKTAATAGDDDDDDDDVKGYRKQRLMNENEKMWSSYLLRCLRCLVRIMAHVLYFCFAVLRSRILRRNEKGSILPSSSVQRARMDKINKSPTFAGAPTLETFLGGILGCLVVFCSLRLLGPWVIRTTEETPLLTVAVSWLTAVGLLLSAGINGFGSVSLPYSCLAGFYLEPIRPEAISQAQQAIQQATVSLQHRKEQLSASAGSTLNTVSTASMSTSRGKSFSDMGEEVKLRRKKLQTEIEFLETLVEEMKDEAKEMQQMQELAASARTFVGRCKLWLGVFLSSILVIRLLAALIFLWNHEHGDLSSGQTQPNKSGSDPITMTLLWLVGHEYVTQQDYNTLSQFISCVMTAILSFSQIRTFIRIIDSVNLRLRHIYQKVHCLTICPSSPFSCFTTAAQSSSGLYENILASLIVCYSLSCVVLTKLMLPSDYRAAFVDALGDETDSILRIRSYSINLTFTLSAVITAFSLGIILGIQRQNIVHHLSVWKATNLDHHLEP